MCFLLLLFDVILFVSNNKLYLSIYLIIKTKYSKNEKMSIKEMEANEMSYEKSRLGVEHMELAQREEMASTTSSTGTTFEWYLLKYPTLILYALSGGLSVVCYAGMM